MEVHMGSARLRYEPGEQRAREMWAEAVARAYSEYADLESLKDSGLVDIRSAVELECVEVVALGCVVPGVTGLVWIELPNSADEPWHHFDVSDKDMREAIQYLVATFGEKVSSHVLWHSHYVHEGPSKVDISTFPEWLVGVGVTYHTPADQSHAYDRSGTLSPLSPSSTPPVSVAS